MTGKLGEVEPLTGTFEGETLRGYDAYKNYEYDSSHVS